MKKTTEIIFLLDRSGSMSGLESDTIGGFNSFVKRQREHGDTNITTILFDDRYEILHYNQNAKEVCLTEKEYYTRGNTALLDAIGKTIIDVGSRIANTAPKSKPGKVIMVITTDGMENASKEYSYNKIKAMVKQQKEKYGWEFIFLGANMDAVETAGRFGIDADRAANYNADSQGTSLNFTVVSEAVSHIRMNKTMAPDWKARIDEDFEKRGKK